MLKPVRRIVTGLDAGKRSAILFDGAADTKGESPDWAGMGVTLLWRSAEVPADNSGSADAAAGPLQLMSSPRGKVLFACKDRACCPGGSESMLSDMERHSALARQRQYTDLSRIPVSMRPEHFVHNVFSPACDMLTRASDIHELFKKAQRRMLSVKTVLLDLHRERLRVQEKRRVPGEDTSPPPTARIIPLSPREPRGR